MRRKSRFLSILVFFLSLNMALQGPVMAQVVVSIAVPIRIRVNITTHPDYYNARLPLQMVSPLVSDLDVDGVLEVISAGYNTDTQRSTVFVWHRNGSVKAGWPVEIDGRIENLPAVGDLDGDGDLEIAVNVRRSTAEPGGWIYVWHHDASLYPGSPYELGYRPGAPLIGDISGGFAEEVYYNPSDVGMALSDVDLDGKKELITAGLAGLGIYERVNDGDELVLMPGGAIELLGAVSVGVPIAGDADGDGLPEIFLAVSQADGNYIYGWRSDGTLITGWPVNAAGVVNTPGAFLSMGDINGDGVSEILTGSTNGWIAGWNLDGRVSFSHRPIDNASIYQPIIGDIDNDSDMEIIATSNNGNIYCYDHNGNPAAGWPRDINYELAPGAILVDIDSDSPGDRVNPAGDLELLYSAYDGKVHAMDLSGSFDPNNIQWGMYGFNPRNTGNYIRDWGTSGWFIFDNEPAVARVESIYDWNRGNRVIELNGDGVNNTFAFRSPDGRPLNSKNTTLQWAMRFSQPFNIYVSVDTIQGRRYLRYTATEGNEPPEGNFIHHGLGGDADNGMWHTFNRSLVQDLKDAQPANEIIDINAVYVQGSGRIDDIALLRGLPAVDLVNLAFIADVAVSSGDGRFINDGDPDTLWVSSGEESPWVEYTWEEPQESVNKIVIEPVEGATGGTVLVTDNNGNVYSINFDIPLDGGPIEITFDSIDNVTAIRVTFNNDGPVSVGEVGVYYDPSLEDSEEGEDTEEERYPSSNYIQIKDGYFFNPVTNSTWIPQGIAYHTWNAVSGQWQGPGELRNDLDLMAGIGVNAIRVDFCWRHIETVDGVPPDWTNYDMLLEEAKARGIVVFPIIGWQLPPSWVPDDWYSVYADGSQSNLISFEDADVQARLINFLQMVVRRYSEGGDREDLGDTIAAWILGNGFSYLDPDPVDLRYIGYDPDSQDAFREWIGADIDMPVSPEEAGWHGLTEWREKSIADFIALAAQAVRAADPAHLITYSSVGLQQGEEDWEYSCEDIKKIKDACGELLDFWSINNYPWAQENSELITGQWPIEKARHDTGLPILITETGFTTTDGIIGIDEARQARLIRNAVWESLESGAIGICVYHWNDRDMPAELERLSGFGIVSIDRGPKPAYTTVGDIFNKMGEVNIAQYLVNSRAPVQDIAFIWDDAVDTIINRYKAEMGALFGTLERLGYEPGFINNEELLGGLYQDYRAIVATRTQRMFGSTFDLLDDIRALGIKIHADSDIPGIMDEYGIRQDDRISVINDLFNIDAGEIAPPALVFGDGTAISLYNAGDSDIDRWTWADRYDLLRSIYTDVGGFNIQPQLNISNKNILVDYRITSDGSLLLSLRNYRADTEETTTVASDLINTKTIVDLFTNGLVEENSDGVIERTLEPDGHEILLARASDGIIVDEGTTDSGSGDTSGTTSGSSPSEASSSNNTDSTSNQVQVSTQKSGTVAPTTQPTAIPVTTTSAKEDEEETVAANRGILGGPITVIILEEGKKKEKDTTTGSASLTSTSQDTTSPRLRIRTYTGSDYRSASGATTAEPNYPETPAVPPVQQFQYAIEDMGNKEAGIIRAEPEILKPAQVEKIIRPKQIEFQTPAPAYDLADSINKWVSGLKDLWKNIVRKMQVAYNFVSRRYV